MASLAPLPTPPALRLPSTTVCCGVTCANSRRQMSVRRLRPEMLGIWPLAADYIISQIWPLHSQSQTSKQAT